MTSPVSVLHWPYVSKFPCLVRCYRPRVRHTLVRTNQLSFRGGLAAPYNLISRLVDIRDVASKIASRSQYVYIPTPYPGHQESHTHNVIYNLDVHRYYSRIQVLTSPVPKPKNLHAYYNSNSPKKHSASQSVPSRSPKRTKQLERPNHSQLFPFHHSPYLLSAPYPQST